MPHGNPGGAACATRGRADYWARRPTVLIDGLPASVMGDTCTCVGPPSTIILGSMTVLLEGRPAARMGDTTDHGGEIVEGSPDVLIGE